MTPAGSIRPSRLSTKEDERAFFERPSDLKLLTILILLESWLMATPLQQGTKVQHRLWEVCIASGRLMNRHSLCNGGLIFLAVVQGYCLIITVTTSYLASQTCLSASYCEGLGQRQKKAQAIQGVFVYSHPL